MLEYVSMVCYICVAHTIANNTEVDCVNFMENFFPAKW